MAEWLFDFFKRSRWPERIVIIVCCLFLMGLALYVGKYGLASSR